MDSSARSAVGAATPHRDGAAAGDGSRPSKRARVEGSSGGGSGSGCTAPQTVDYVGFYKHKVPNADRRYKNFCNLYKAPYVVPVDGAALLPRIRGTTFQTVEGTLILLIYIYIYSSFIHFVCCKLEDTAGIDISALTSAMKIRTGQRADDNPSSHPHVRGTHFFADAGIFNVIP